MSDKVKVSSYMRDGEKVCSHTRSAPGKGVVRLVQTLASTDDNNYEDTLMIKEMLQSMGYYEPVKDIGMNGYPDNQLFEGIKEFQKDNGLTIDGIIKPGGETENALNYGLAGIGRTTGRALEKGREAHYGRLDLIHDDLHSGYGTEIINKEKDIWIKEDPAIAHNLHGASGNVGYRGKVGSYREGQQVILDRKGYIVNTHENIGTPDFSSPEGFSGVVKHAVKDVAPWIVWGNSPQDRTKWNERLEGSTIRLKKRKNLLKNYD